jgi:hypothetical protein
MDYAGNDQKGKGLSRSSGICVTRLRQSAIIATMRAGPSVPRANHRLEASEDAGQVIRPTKVAQLRSSRPA